MTDALGDDELERYARHIVLREIGGQGQQKLKAARVAVIGAGGLGSPCIQYLAAAGIGRLRIIDDDVVSLSNLQRQVLHGTGDMGRPKVDSARDAVRRINPHVAVEPVAERLVAGNAAALLGGCDCVADGSDSFATRLIVADTALALRVPLVSAAVGSFDGQLGVFKGWLADMPCYRCLVGGDPQAATASCADTGVLGALTGVMGALQALEVVREITGFAPSRAGVLLLYDALAARMRSVALPKDPRCPICAAG